MTGIGHCFVAGRISYVFGLHGACEAADTACSAALVALHSAHRGAQLRECEAALVAGVNAMIIPATLDNYAAAGLTSPSGKSYVFDARANGFARGEGCATGLLSACDVSAVHALQVTGSAVRQDGKSASLTAPNGRAQKLLFDAVLADACVAPSDLQLAESAANGSAMGDAIESGAMAAGLLSRRSHARLWSGP